MRNILYVFSVLLTLTLSVHSASGQIAQLMSPNRPEQDPCGAISLCGTSFTSDSSYNGPGLTFTPAGCAGESNSMWLRVDVVQSGTIVFVITPQNPLNDYDFAVFQSTNCNNLGAPIRCNANNNNPGSNINGQIGLNATSTITNVPGGSFGNSYLQQITAIAPSTYYIMLDNALTGYTPPQIPDGFTIDFSGSTALFAGGIQPLYDSVARTCNTSNGIRLFMNQGIKCSSVASDGSDFQLIPAAANVSAASPFGCSGPQNLSNTIDLTFSSPLPIGHYILKAKVGTDGNTLLNVCNSPQPVSDTIEFDVVKPLSVYAGIDTLMCINQSLQLNGIVTGGGASNALVWTPGTGLNNPFIPNPISTATTNTSYTLTVTPNNLTNCAVSDVVNVQVLQGFDIQNNDTTICKGATVVIGTIGDPRYQYTWSPGTYLTSTGSPNTASTPDTTITYTLVAHRAGCPDSLQRLKITVEPVPTVYVGVDRTLCYGDTVQMAPTVLPSWFTGYTYSWTPAANFDRPNDIDPLYTATDTTTIILTVKTPAGCTGADGMDYNVIPKDFATVSADDAICPRDSAQLTVDGGLTYVWFPQIYINDPTSSTPTVSPYTSTNYTVYSTNFLGCKDTDDVYITVHPEALLNLPDSTRIYPGERYQMNPGGNGLYFSWFPPLGLSSTNSSNPIASPEVNTRYFVTATTEHGCSVYDSIDVYVNPETAINLPNAFTPGSAPNAKFGPNINGLVTIRSFRIFNRWGQEVFSTTNPAEGWNGSYKGEPQPMGVYIYYIDAVTSSGRVFQKQGNVTLIR